MKTAAAAALLWIACAEPGMAGGESAGYDFLSLPQGARAAALGGANISADDGDATMALANPALLHYVPDHTAGLHFLSYAGGACGGAVFNHAVGARSTVALSAQYMGYGDIRHTDEYGADLGKFSAKDVAVAGHFSYLLADNLVGGVAAKLAASYIAGYSSVAMAVDLGVNYANPETGWSFSLAAKNLGGELKAFADEYGRLPVDVRAGVSKRLAHTPLRLHATLDRLTSWGDSFGSHLSIGADLVLSETLWVGGGYNFARSSAMAIADGEGLESAHGAGLSFGAGLSAGNFQVGAAWSKYHVSNSALVLNVSYSM